MIDHFEFILLCLVGLGLACAANLIVIAIEDRHEFKWYKKLTGKR